MFIHFEVNASEFSENIVSSIISNSWFFIIGTRGLYGDCYKHYPYSKAWVYRGCVIHMFVNPLKTGGGWFDDKFHGVICLWPTLYNQRRRNISLRFSSNSETFASELLENLKRNVTYRVIRLSYSVLPVTKWLNISVMCIYAGTMWRSCKKEVSHSVTYLFMNN